MNMSTVKKRFLPTMVKRYDYRYEKSNVVNDFGMFAFQNLGRDKIKNVEIFQHSNIPTFQHSIFGTNKWIPIKIMDCRYKFCNILKNNN